MRKAIFLYIDGGIISCFASCKTLVKFKLPPDHRSRSNSDSNSNSDCDSDLSVSSSSSVSSSELILTGNGHFSQLRKDDDLLALKKRKRKRKKKQKKNNTANANPNALTTSNCQQPVGFLWSAKSALKITDNLKKLTEGIIENPINVGWWLFAFNCEKDSVSNTIFRFKTRFPVRVSLVDLYYRGDSFMILDFGKLIAQSSRIPPDFSGGKEEMTSPMEALKDGRWSSVIFELDSGDHEITLKTLDNPTKNGGVAAIKFDHILPPIGRKLSRNKVCRGYNNLIVITEPMSAIQAELACLSMKSEITRMDKQQMDKEFIKRSLKSCTNREMKVWALDGDELKVYGMDLVPLTDLTKKYPVLCTVRK